tara:strand:+ start:7235 stop:7372 length:138 start_codon:yes stop_codon:yes gene_type:complete
MLFEYNNFWKRVVFISASWCAYLVFGFEITVVSLLALICINNSLK